ncbi:hypothetical protein NDU88_001322 [Pleurodeles waltl]|uniref:Uncharacterized protein n=1 Tax=Pleurodeles waltl TaxID=8319 RepID=A0AAV7LAM9_PLEWA|nr:hypothetical protein NDU88_001322 [Pleurodeles waltl]
MAGAAGARRESNGGQRDTWKWQQKLSTSKEILLTWGQHIDTLEQTHNACEEELDCHRGELLTLQDKNQELQYQLEDLENGLRHSNILIKVVPAQAMTGNLEEYVVRHFRHVAPALKEQNIVLERTQRAGPPTRSPGQTQDILICLHYYKQREAIMAAVRDQTMIEFEGHRKGLFHDLSMLTLQCHRALQLVMDFLRERGIRYKWGHRFHL